MAPTDMYHITFDYLVPIVGDVYVKSPLHIFQIKVDSNEPYK